MDLGSLVDRLRQADSRPTSSLLQKAASSSSKKKPVDHDEMDLFSFDLEAPEKPAPIKTLLQAREKAAPPPHHDSSGRGLHAREPCTIDSSSTEGSLFQNSSQALVLNAKSRHDNGHLDNSSNENTAGIESPHENTHSSQESGFSYVMSVTNSQPQYNASLPFSNSQQIRNPNLGSQSTRPRESNQKIIPSALDANFLETLAALHPQTLTQPLDLTKKHPLFSQMNEPQKAPPLLSQNTLRGPSQPLTSKKPVETAVNPPSVGIDLHHQSGKDPKQSAPTHQFRNQGSESQLHSHLPQQLPSPSHPPKSPTKRNTGTMDTFLVHNQTQAGSNRQRAEFLRPEDKNVVTRKEIETLVPSRIATQDLLAVSARRTIPGPAGIVYEDAANPTASAEVPNIPQTQQTKTTQQQRKRHHDPRNGRRDDEAFVMTSAWKKVLLGLNFPVDEPLPKGSPLFQYTIQTIVAKDYIKKIPNLIVMIKVIHAVENDCFATFKDPTGEMDGAIHRDVLKKFRNDVVNGSVLLLKNVSIFNVSERIHYLNITTNNVSKVVPPEKQEQSPSRRAHESSTLELLDSLQRPRTSESCQVPRPPSDAEDVLSVCSPVQPAKPATAATSATLAPTLAPTPPRAIPTSKGDNLISQTRRTSTTSVAAPAKQTCSQSDEDDEPLFLSAPSPPNPPARGEKPATPNIPVRKGNQPNSTPKSSRIPTNTTPFQNQAEQNQVEQNQVEQTQVEQNQVEQNQVEQNQVEQNQVEQNQAAPRTKATAKPPDRIRLFQSRLPVKIGGPVSLAAMARFSSKAKKPTDELEDLQNFDLS
eukprot:TRINITY_DN5171_c0_g1_i1.p1 TRINITY_DN5171_c0_g1~~TRINITY_DN5171_c0_g1_i1.p1  ORF type:complete len:812 (-),score=166.26 TRINITY_DN5171_c0_g1_i1:156-2591(-)